MIYLVLGVAIGVLMPSQSAINNRLRNAVATPWVMAGISFLVGTVCLALLTWATVGTVGFDLGNVVTQPWWIWSGGVFGVIGMTTNVLLLPVIGALYSTMLNLTAQVITTMIIDHLGLLGVDHYPADGWRITGAVLVMVAAALAVIGGRRRPQLNAQPTSKTWYLAGLGIGVCFGLQVAINGQLTLVLGSAVHSAFISFLVGTFVLTVVVVLTRPSLRLRVPEGQTHNPWWMWMGGVLGALYVTGVAFLSPLIGSAVTVVVVQVGLIAGSLLVDQFGLFSAPKRAVRPLQVIGLLLMISGVFVMNAPKIFV
ncbi:MAG TPA: DMT family transporter [Enteractinococcus helveticum]|uniref:DMT family transporter n=1 Tax=Enteractinococcus helveticum TaxID=1837282 RepID=A0A921K6W4_9MICC|nr:DMT family transporter [Enteractinococcus helveticum]HJF14030.1 DMT family transporter [Enteractinococcus helveticum]